MIFRQYYLGCLAHASYLVGDERSRVAAVVDPQRDVEQYVADARRLGVRIRHVFLTHLHADFVAGHLELRERENATIHLGGRAAAEYPFRPARDGDRVVLGPNVRLDVLETPGHTPESVSLLIYDQPGTSPQAVLTGDTLFIGDVGRPDLAAAPGWTAEQLAAMLYESLRGKLLPLPDATLIYPAHGAGSLCGRNLSTDTVSTIGEQRRHNYALQPMSQAQFVGLVTADQPEAPPYFAYDAVLNAKQRPVLEQALSRELRPLSLEEVLLRLKQGAQVLDTRDPADFEGGHLRRAITVGLGGSYATWCGTVLDRERPVVIVADPGSETEAAVRLGRIGFDIVAGYLAGGMQELTSRPDLVARVKRLTATALAEQQTSIHPPLLLDVRSQDEHRAQRIAGSLNVPLPRLPRYLPQLPADRPFVVHCATGYRSAIAASLLLTNGYRRVSDLTGGIAAWTACELPTERAE
jgi:glyoxylase-like metal-dependent hydrolase (beta-lactamase superfamily II)/rhodanese-related sulfurtransferase